MPKVAARRARTREKGRGLRARLPGLRSARCSSGFSSFFSALRSSTLHPLIPRCVSACSPYSDILRTYGDTEHDVRYMYFVSRMQVSTECANCQGLTPDGQCPPVQPCTCNGSWCKCGIFPCPVICPSSAGGTPGLVPIPSFCVPPPTCTCAPGGGTCNCGTVYTCPVTCP